MKLIKYQRGGRCPDPAGMLLTIEKRKNPFRGMIYQGNIMGSGERWGIGRIGFQRWFPLHYKRMWRSFFLISFMFLFSFVLLFCSKSQGFFLCLSLVSGKPHVWSYTCSQCGEPNWEHLSKRVLVTFRVTWLVAFFSFKRKLFCSYFHGAKLKTENYAYNPHNSKSCEGRWLFCLELYPRSLVQCLAHSIASIYL